MTLTHTSPAANTPSDSVKDFDNMAVVSLLGVLRASADVHKDTMVY